MSAGRNGRTDEGISAGIENIYDSVVVIKTYNRGKDYVKYDSAIFFIVLCCRVGNASVINIGRPLAVAPFRRIILRGACSASCAHSVRLLAVMQIALTRALAALRLWKLLFLENRELQNLLQFAPVGLVEERVAVRVKRRGACVGRVEA